MKRYTETTKWSDPWFVDLDPKAKVFWLYLLDNCDHSGTWEKFEKKFQFETGIGISIKALVEDLGDRIIDLGDKILIPKFIKFQFGSELSSTSNYHKPILKALEHHGHEMDDQGLVKGCSRVAQGLVKGWSRVGQGLLKGRSTLAQGYYIRIKIRIRIIRGMQGGRKKTSHFPIQSSRRYGKNIFR